MDGVRNRRSNQTDPKKINTNASTVIARRKLSSDSTVTELTLVGDDSTPPLERRKRRWSPPTSPIGEESDEDELNIDSLLEETKLDDTDNKEESKEKKSSSTVTVMTTVHGQKDTS